MSGETLTAIFCELFIALVLEIKKQFTSLFLRTRRTLNTATNSQALVS